MAAETFTFEQSVSYGSDKLTAGALTNTANSADKITAAVTSLQTSLQIDMAFEYTKLSAIAILSTVGGNLKTNATDATGGNTVTFFANELFIWRGTSGANPFTHDVTTAYLNNTDSAAGSVKIWILRNPLA
jgi:hypothetical protein